MSAVLVDDFEEDPNIGVFVDGWIVMAEQKVLGIRHRFDGPDFLERSQGTTCTVVDAIN